MRWGLVAAAAVIGLAGCTTVGDEAPREIRTASDVGEAERRARLRLELAAGYFGRGQATTALDEVKVALAAKPDLHEAWNLRGLIYASLGEPRLAEESFDRALALAPRDADTLHNHGFFLCQQRRFADAEAQFAKALAQPRYASPARTMLASGICQARAGRLDEAEKALSRAYELDAASPVIAFNLSDVLLRRGDLERARFYVRRVNARPETTNAQSLWLAARIEHRAGNVAAAAVLGRQLRDRFPQSTEALQFDRGRFEE
jgi:type IV pilus assembly protein PilF